ncbi:NYN domain-containing protein [Patescibacteria group bacterium]|nr:NYN domain-containing protein [Patescibacteria group bacterium]MCL5091551.1 NYN domain-containing protein [Patescibacteria group bacterium]
MKNKKRVTYAFIDATNIIYGTGGAGWKVDFKKLISYLKGRYQALKVLYYGGVDSNNQKQLNFYKKLKSFGYELRLVPVKTFKDGKKKADVDSRMTFEIMLLLNQYNNAIFMTGDGDFFWVFEYLIQTKINVKLIANSRSTARELKQLFKQHFTDLQLLRHLVAKKNEVDAFVESTSRGYGKSISRVKNSVKKKNNNV